MLIFKRGISKLQLSFILLIILLITFTGVFAALQSDQISINFNSQTATSQSIMHTKNNYEVVSENKNGFNVSWFPKRVGLVDKEYLITIKNLESRQRNVNLGAFFKALTKDIGTILPDSVQLYYLTDLTEVVDDYSTICIEKQIVLSQGQQNQTTTTVKECTTYNDPKTITYKGWKAYPINEVRDKIKKEIRIQKTNENGKIELPANGFINLNLIFKTKILARDDGAYGNDGQFGLFLDDVSYHPSFNVSFNKRYLINYTTNDALDTNFTHNITFAFTGNANELGSAMYTYGNVSLLACNNIHIIFNGTTEIDAWVDQCNTSSFSIYFKNQFNNTANTTYNELYELYYDPSGSSYQRPQDWGAIWLPPSDNFAAGLNTSRWFVDNTTSTGNSTWINHSGTDGVIKIGIGLDDEAGNDGCFSSLVNISQDNWAVEIIYIRNTTFLQHPNNKAYGMNNRKCGGSPNTNAGGAFVYGDGPEQIDKNFELRTATNGVLTTTAFGSRGLADARWDNIIVNRTGTPAFATNRSGLSWRNATGEIVHLSNTSNTAGSGSGTPLAFLLREAYAVGIVDTKEITMVDAVRVYQLVSKQPNYTLIQQNKTGPTTVTLNTMKCTAENRENVANIYNDSCEGNYPASCGPNTTNDFLSCDDGNLETQTYRHNKFTGLHIQSFNNSVTDCASIANVTLCYRWWTIGGSSTSCLVAVDSNANSSYSTVNTTCPNMINATCPEASPTPLLVCTDVTSLENWTCSSFFGTNGTRAVARTELSAPNPGPSQMLRTDALFFNVTYGKL